MATKHYFTVCLAIEDGKDVDAALDEMDDKIGDLIGWPQYGIKAYYIADGGTPSPEEEESMKRELTQGGGLQ